MSALIRLHDVRRTYRLRAETVAAVDGISLTLGAGTLTGLAGPSGSGKTTLVNLIVGWEHPDDGLVVRDTTVSSDWEGIAVIPQSLGLLDELTVEENVDLPCRLGNGRAMSAADAMQMLSIEHLASRLPSEISLGEQQRTAVARALVAQSSVVVADEPTSHQDEANALAIGRLLRDVADRGCAVLIATHDDRILATADRVVHIVDGSIVEAVA